MRAVENRYVKGYEDGTFKPDSPVASAEFMKMFVSAFGHDVDVVQREVWYTPYLVKAIQEYYITASAGSSINWTAEMSRTDVVNMSLSFQKVMPTTAKKAWYEATTRGIIVGKDAKGYVCRICRCTLPC